MSRQILRSLPLHRPPYLVRAYSTYRSPATRNVRLPTIFGAVLAVAGLVGWRLTSSQRIALDAQQRPSHASTQLSAHIDEKKGTAQLRTSAGTTEDSSSDSQPQETPQPRQASLEQSHQLEEEESGEAGAFNPETGEINWDCPCLGGMAHGPCGLQFREAFSCFVFSEKEPKGIDCIDKFRLMQECFREHPDVYGEELVGDDEADEPPDSQSSSEPSVAPPASSPTEGSVSEFPSQSTERE